MEAEEKQLRIKRSSLLPIDVKRSDRHFTVRNLGVQKQLAHNKQLREFADCEWVLLYPDFDLVVTLPGTTEPFTVEKYKECLGRPYSRVNLYICRLDDFEGKLILENVAKLVDKLHCCDWALITDFLT